MASSVHLANEIMRNKDLPKKSKKSEEAPPSLDRLHSELMACSIVADSLCTGDKLLVEENALVGFLQLSQEMVQVKS